jgi:hypothetical protein
MTIDKSTIILRLQPLERVELIARARAYLEQEDTRPISESPTRVTVSEALRLWSTRRKNTEITGVIIHGIDSLVEALERLSPEVDLDQFGFVSDSIAITVFFKNEDHGFVGLLMVNRPPELVKT